MSFHAYQPRFPEPAYVSMDDPPDIDWTCDVDEVPIRDEDGLEITLIPEVRLNCEWKAGEPHIKSIEIRQYRQRQFEWVRLSGRDTPTAQMMCNAVRRYFRSEASQRLLLDAYSDAVEELSE